MAAAARSPFWLPAATLLALSALRGALGVNCGGHFADECQLCPQGHGPDWCNGDCRWVDGECAVKGTRSKKKTRSSELGFPYPPDTRPAGCASEFEDLSNLTVSIIIPWLAEAWEHMEGTMLSLLHFTPMDLVEEIIFISDGNPDTREKELKALSPKVRVIANAEREGLIRAKMKGVRIALAPVIVFLEAHCILNRGWLQPLLTRVKLDPKTLAMPALDVIPMTDWWSYSTMPPGHWRYEWNLNLIYSNPGNTIKHSKEVYPSPGTSGGIFAMRKDWFEELGLFDPGMLEWGGDHVELTFKVWRCGGRIDMVPCSRLGHLFRDPAHRPYDVEVNQVVRNYNRLARVWMKDHIDLFLKMKPESVSMPFKDQEEMMKRHDDLNCKDMSWYLENVDHEMAWEMDKICHPHARKDDPIKCKGPMANGRWTVNSTNIISKKVYLAIKKAAEEQRQEQLGKPEL